MIEARDLDFFGVVAASPSLAAAARALNVSAPAVSQRLQAMEGRLAVRLVDRRGGRLTLTDEGKLVAAHCQTVAEEIGALKDALAERRRQIVGRLRVAAPFGFGRRHVAPLVGGFCKDHPEVVVDLILSDQMVGVGLDAWDIAFHVGPLDEAVGSLIARRLAPNRRFVCAAPRYLSRHGVPARPEELAGHHCIVLQENAFDGAVWCLRSADHAEQRVRVKARLTTNDGEIARSWALAGLGLVLRSEWDVADDLRAGRLVRLLEGYSGPQGDITALLSARPHSRPARTILFLDHVSKALHTPPWRSETWTDGEVAV